MFRKPNAAMLAPMPMASITTAVTVKPGERHNMRAA